MACVHPVCPPEPIGEREQRLALAGRAGQELDDLVAGLDLTAVDHAGQPADRLEGGVGEGTSAFGFAETPRCRGSAGRRTLAFAGRRTLAFGGRRTLAFAGLGQGEAASGGRRVNRQYNGVRPAARAFPS